MSLKKGDILEGRYEILRKIGQGGMSTVWLAMDVGINVQWAIKEIHKDSPEYIASVDEGKVLKETNLMKKLNHPAFPRITDIIDRPDSICVIMDYIEGMTLSKVLKNYGPQEQSKVVAWMVSLCDILDYLHHQDPPIIYRDMKPANIMINHEGNLKVIDFGIARRYKKGMEDTTCLGTKGYASPEHFTGHTDVRSDIYTLGATMFHLLTGKSPLDTPFDLTPITKINPALSSGLEKIIVKATRSNPDDRYQTMGELKRALLNYHLLEEEHLDTYRKSIRSLARLVAIGSFCIIFGIGSLVIGIIQENNKYETLINAASTNTTEREAQLEKAIALKPEREEGYLKLIEAYSQDGAFTEEEASAFTEIYAESEGKMKKGEDYGNLNFSIGSAFLAYYTGKSDASARNSLLTAKPFFEKAEEGKNADIAKNYVSLAEYYQKYIIGSQAMSVNEAGKKEYLKLLKEMNGILKHLSKYKGSDKKHMSLSTDAILLGILDSQRISMEEAGIAQEEILSIISDIEENAQGISSSVEVTVEKKKEVLSDCSKLTREINETYQEAKKVQQKTKKGGGKNA